MSEPGETPDPSAASATSWLQTVAGDIRLIDRSSTAERVADVLRRRITEGDLPPRTHLSEEQLIVVLRVSRNTLREAFRLLSHEGLLVHELHRGVFVRELDDADLVDLYRLRRDGRVRRGPVADGGGRRPGCGGCTTTWPRPRRRPGGVTGWRSAPPTCSSTATWWRWPAARGPTRSPSGCSPSCGSPSTPWRVPQRLHETYVARNRALVDLLAAGEFEKAAEPARGVPRGLAGRAARRDARVARS